MKGWFLIGLLTLGALAGCLSSSTDHDSTTGTVSSGPVPQRYVLPEDPMPEGAGHDHTNPDQHKFLWHYAFSARDGLMQNQANIAGLHAMDLQDGYLFGAIYGSHAASIDGGLQIWDVTTDPAHPKALGKWTIPGSVGGDRAIGATPDGDYAVIGLEPVDCLGHVNPFAVVDAYLIDTRNKNTPVVSDVVTITGNSLGNGPMSSGINSGGHHSVYVHRINGVDYAFLFGDIYRIDRSETGARLVLVGNIPTGHDIYVRDTPWNTTWAMSANGEGPLVVWDVTNPMAPFKLAQWDLENRLPRGDPNAYYFHTADVEFLADGTVLIVLSSEDWTDHVSPLWVLDGNPLAGMTSAPKEPVQLQMVGTWHNPGNHTAIGTSFSLHNPRLHDNGILTISSYHAGFWQLDLRTQDFRAKRAPIAYGAYADGTPALALDPAEDTIENQLCGLGIKMDTPTYMDVAVGENGTLYFADAFMGLYTFTPTADHPVFGTAAKTA